MEIKPILVDMVRSGIPIVTTLVGYHYSKASNHGFMKTLGYTSGGFLAGYFAQKMLLALTEANASKIPSKMVEPANAQVPSNLPTGDAVKSVSSMNGIPRNPNIKSVPNIIDAEVHDIKMNK